MLGARVRQENVGPGKLVQMNEKSDPVFRWGLGKIVPY